MSSLISFFQAVLAKTLFFAYRLVGLRLGSYLGGRLGLLAGKISPDGQRAADNLAKAMPHLSEAEQEQVKLACFEQVGRVFGEMAHLPKIAREADSRLSIEGAEHVEAALPDGGPAIFIGGHFANWEVVMLGIQRLVGDTGALYREPKNVFMRKWLLNQRDAFMPIKIPAGPEGSRELLKTLKGGTSVALLIDQSLPQGDPITFMGRKTRAPSAAMKLARRFDIPIIPTVVRRRHDGPDKTHFVQHFFPAFRVAQTDDTSADIDAAMRQAYDLFEQWIETRPEEWLWPYNRWK
ncbi:MAG: hypothetical protein HN715_00520 [Rhodobiaceae bacterium]|jgi:KDO2-lipid IV(A) lauroyltransferase|nr:hypothetical protein [Rhodobiaceae bacterium]